MAVIGALLCLLLQLQLFEQLFQSWFASFDEIFNAKCCDLQLMPLLQRFFVELYCSGRRC
jgi:hypothetical protein